MSDARSTAEPASRPEGDGAGVPERIAGLLRLIQLIVGYGKIFAETLHERSAENFRIFAARYRRPEFAEILARIKRGLLLAAALEQKLLRRAGTGRDVVPTPYRSISLHRARDASAPKRTRVRRVNIVDMPPDQLPSAAQIAAELRRRPIGAVLADICRDLGIRPGDLTIAEWQELHEAIIAYGGDSLNVTFAEPNLRMRAVAEAGRRRRKPGRESTPAPADTGASRTAAASPTGPPPLTQAA